MINEDADHIENSFDFSTYYPYPWYKEKISVGEKSSLDDLRRKIQSWRNTNERMVWIAREYLWDADQIDQTITQKIETIIYNLKPGMIVNIDFRFFSNIEIWVNLLHKLPQYTGVFCDYQLSSLSIKKICSALQPGNVLYLKGNTTTADDFLKTVLSTLKQGTLLCLSHHVDKTFIQNLSSAWDSLALMGISPKVDQLHLAPKMEPDIVAFALESLSNKFKLIKHDPKHEFLILPEKHANKVGSSTYSMTANDTKISHAYTSQPIKNQPFNDQPLVESSTESDNYPLNNDSSDSMIIEEPQPSSKHSRDEAPILMGIANKYLREENKRIPKPYYLDSTKQNELDPVISKQPNAFELEYSLFSAITTSPADCSIVQCSFNYSDTIKLTFLSKHQSPLTSSTQLYFIMAGRDFSEQLLPVITPNSLTRCVLIVTQTEWDNLDAQEGHARLFAGYDVLIISSFSFLNQQLPRLESLNIRRRAALYLACELGVARIIMADDNIQTIYCSPSNNSLDGLDSLYAFMTNQMQEKLVISISTINFKESSENYLNNALGSKLFMLSMPEIIKNKKNTTSGWQEAMALFPLDENAFGEDYFMQLILEQLKPHTSSGHNYGIISPKLAQIKRSTQARNAFQQQGRLAEELSCDSAQLNQLKPLLSDTMYDVFLKSMGEFNRLYQEQLDRLQAHSDFMKNTNFYNNPYGITAYRKAKLALRTPVSGDFSKEIDYRLNRFLAADLSQLKMKPFQHQVDALRFFKDNHQASNQLTFSIATGCGKTYIQAWLATHAFLSTTTKHSIIVCPTIDLVLQTKAKFSEYCDELTSQRDEVWPRIIHICSDSNAISIPAFNENDNLKNESHVFIICKRSFDILSGDTSPSSILHNTGMIIFDESHVVFKKETQDYLQTNYPNILNLLFSATPNPETILSISKLVVENNQYELNAKKAVAEGRLIGFREEPQEKVYPLVYEYPREQAIMDRNLVPFIVDDSINKLSVFNIITLLKSHLHADTSQKTPLLNHKTIIFVQSINDAEEMYSKLIQDLAFASKVYCIHSKNANHQNDLKSFKACQSGIAIAVDMLIAGYDDCLVDCVIINKKITDKDTETQIIGRALRLNGAAKQMALIIFPSEMNQIKNSTERHNRVISGYQTAQITLADYYEKTYIPAAGSIIRVSVFKKPPTDRVLNATLESPYLNHG